MPPDEGHSRPCRGGLIARLVLLLLLSLNLAFAEAGRSLAAPQELTLQAPDPGAQLRTSRDSLTILPPRLANHPAVAPDDPAAPPAALAIPAPVTLPALVRAPEASHRPGRPAPRAFAARAPPALS